MEERAEDRTPAAAEKAEIPAMGVSGLEERIPRLAYLACVVELVTAEAGARWSERCRGRRRDLAISKMQLPLGKGGLDRQEA